MSAAARVAVAFAAACLLLCGSPGRCNEPTSDDATGHADAEAPAQPEPEPLPEVEPNPEPKPEPETKSEPEAKFEGAVGLLFSYRPEYGGATARTTTVSPGYYIRYGRYTLTNASGFSNDKGEDVLRGFTADLVNTNTLRVNFGLRIDNGRSASDSDALAGLGSIPSTIRGRLTVHRPFDKGWSTTFGTSLDMLGRGGGMVFDLGLGRFYRLAPRTMLSWSVGVSAGDSRYMQAYYGITEEQSTASGYAVYMPGAGLRDASAGISLRSDIGPRWVGFVGIGASRLLGPVSHSPLTQSQSAWGLNGGLAWRF